MAYSYDEILERMENKYLELTGHEASECGDIGIRLKILAGEIYSMGSNIDWLKRQMFFTTATGEQLDMFAAQRGLTRIRGNKARGDIIVSFDSPIDYEMVIPEGTVFTTPDGSLNYIVEKQVLISRGGERVICPAVAEHTGRKYNVNPGNITTVVTYFTVGMYIDNTSTFTGGTDDESDEHLRERIAASYRNISNGANAAYYRSIAENVEGVQSAAVIENSDSQVNSVSIAVGGRGNVCTDECLSAVKEAINAGRCAGHNVTVKNAELITYNLSFKIAVKAGHDSAQVTEKAKDSVRNYFNSLSVGQDVFLAEIGRILMNTDGVENYSFGNMQDKKATASGLIVLGAVTVSNM